MGVLFLSQQELVWDPERSVGAYNLYRDLMSNLPLLGFGSCAQSALTDETATDNDPVPAGDGFFYLVTAENRLEEEGTKGSQSDGTQRAEAFTARDPAVVGTDTLFGFDQVADAG